ncbi:ubiquinone/menaquinone biosynthesis C-methyltransferase UbiE-like isoform X1 [Branchiostoma floridae]|uniref:2-methoxy-6-polyprenyl-1,4-benzoquinol methylase, mitochondrial n=2 Tax=Branchiostoma floridae TaxID=7739 RepID=A0A9J7LYS0_BRAFL|nr:ubiquinone/menaquinone biosynthesis C-methyltransferase UbiE-like isoform X1 [Branchiostoma floridae]
MTYKTRNMAALWCVSVRLGRVCRCSNRIIASRRNLSEHKSSDETDKEEGTEKSTHFGFESINESEKTGKVHEVFSNVASKYDVMNDAMSLGVHRLWKDRFMQVLDPLPGTRLLDVAGGTGDIAFRFINWIKEKELQQKKASPGAEFRLNPLETDDSESAPDLEFPSAEDYLYSEQREDTTGTDDRKDSKVIICDINQSMLEVGKERAKKLGLEDDVVWVTGNAEELPFPDNSVDAYTIAFGIRNVTHIEKVLCEAYRVLTPGGRFLCLEFSQVSNPLLSSVYDLYSFQVIPVLGELIASDWKSYQYLVESIRKFPNQEEFAEMIREAGFRMVSYENLTSGVAAIHSGFKI